MNKAQQHPLSWREFQVLVVSIIERLVALLALLEALSDLHDELVPIA
jgi:hypothetical protein